MKDVLTNGFKNCYLTSPKAFGLKLAKLGLKIPLKNKVKQKLSQAEPSWAKLKGQEKIWERIGQGKRELKGLIGKRQNKEEEEKKE